jgi:hypothetical protein
MLTLAVAIVWLIKGNRSALAVWASLAIASYIIVTSGVSFWQGAAFSSSSTHLWSVLRFLFFRISEFCLFQKNEIGAS